MTGLSHLFTPETLLSLFALLFAITVHEASHAWTAMKFGDPTASSMGRVSLNPLVHIDPFGTVLLPLILTIMNAPAFGWAKPVIINPRNLRRPRRDNLWISLAGPAANFATAAGALILIRVIRFWSPASMAFLFGYLSGQPAKSTPFGIVALILWFFVIINCYLAVFNLIPVPPLDGSGVLMGLLPYEAAATYGRLSGFPFGMIIIMALVALGVLNVIAQPIYSFALTLIFS
jgi:Zn-dependent protease